MILTPELIEELICKVQWSKKYRNLHLPRPTLVDILQHEAPAAKNKAALKTALRHKLHNILAPYLEDLDYEQEKSNLLALAAQKPDSSALKSFAAALQEKHASSRERLLFLQEFYTAIFSRTGTPDCILDLACALNPLALPWMNLPASTRYLAYDIHQPRVEFLASFFRLFYPQAEAIQQDILVQPPEAAADIAFFFKEAHRFEKRRTGAIRPFFESLSVSWLVVSLPAADLSGHHSLVSYHNRLIETAIQGKPWQLQSQQIGNELLYLIRKS
jgi:16S rRNA (guanine(1405)-N(7))-methyltransferase